MASLFKRNNGIYYVAYWDGNRRVWVSTRTNDHSNAQEFNEQNVLPLERRRGMTICSFEQDFLVYAKAHYADGNVQIYNRSFEAFVKVIGNKLLKLVTTRDVDNFKEKRIREAKPVTINIQFRTLKAAFEKAVRWGYIATNPFKLSEPFRISYEDAPFVSQEEFLRLLQKEESGNLRTLWLVAVMTGMRRGELLHVEWTDIDFVNCTIHIKNKPDFQVKGRRQRRIPMNPTVAKVLLQTPHNGVYVFCDLNGKPLTGAYVTRRFKRAATLASMNNRIHLHSLRHSTATWLAQAGGQAFTIQQGLGHSSVIVTQGYMHALPENLREAFNKLVLPEEVIARIKPITSQSFQPLHALPPAQDDCKSL